MKCATGFIYACTVDFYIDWLEGMEGDVRDGQFGSVASGLALLKRKSITDQVFTGLRPFPTTWVNKERRQAAITSMPLADYLKTAAPTGHAELLPAFLLVYRRR